MQKYSRYILDNMLKSDLFRRGCVQTTLSLGVDWNRDNIFQVDGDAYL